MKRLKGKVAIVTGAGTGLGKETALLFAREGAAVVVCGRRKHKIEEVKEEILAAGGTVLDIHADVSREIDVNRLVSATLSTFNRIDILINNAAVFENQTIGEMNLESWNYQFSNNVTSTFLMSKACLPAMRKQKEGRIITITSGLAKNGAPGFGAYSASKAAIEIMTRSLSEEEHTNGIIANIFNPGVMKTELQSTGVHPSAVAPLLLELCISEERTITGQLIEAP